MKKSHSSLSKNEPVYCKEGWFARSGQEGGFLHKGGGGIVWNTLKGGGIEKREVETKILKRGQAGFWSGCLKKRGRGLKPPYKLWTPVQRFVLKFA